VTTLNLGAGSKSVPPEIVVGEVVSVDLSGRADVTADVRSLPFPDEHADCLYASHLLEHFDEHELPVLLAEWRRVLKRDGRLVIEVPDIHQVAQRIVENGVDAVLYQAPAGQSIRAQDALYGWQERISEGLELMRHKIGFDGVKLGQVLQAAGFVGRVGQFRFTLIANVRRSDGLQEEASDQTAER
jgi:predicted SAM-dependent methyltransferase